VAGQAQRDTDPGAAASAKNHCGTCAQQWIGRSQNHRNDVDNGRVCAEQVPSKASHEGVGTGERVIVNSGV